MQKIVKFSILVLIFMLLVVPTYSFAGPPLVPDCDNLTPTTQCDFTKFMTLINNVVRFVFVYLAVPICAIMFAYAGFLLLTSGGSTEAMSRAKSIFSDAALGLIIAAAAFLIVKTILSILDYKGAWIGF
ncbi:MAG: hypothetical protein Q8O46_02605 [bacterium]|nr:hypothetical protein [bacterium]